MKRRASVVATAAFAGVFSQAAVAQSSVTLYGVIDEGLNYTSNVQTQNGTARTGSKQFNLSSGVLSGSRWGMRGTEDLGGGLKAIFVLENGFDLNTGRLNQGGAEFGRQAYIGLSNGLGTLTIGRQYDSVVDYVGQLEAGDQWGGYLAAHPDDLDNFNNANRVNNAIKYASPNFSGLTFGGLYSLGGVAGDFNRNQIWSVGANYTQGPLVLAAGFLAVRDPNFALFGNVPSSSTTGNNIGSQGPIQGSPVISGFATAKNYQVIGAAGAYAIGAATLGLTYSNVKFKDLGSVAVVTAGGTPAAPGYTGNASFNNGEINFRYQFTPALLAGVAYDYTKGTGAAGQPGSTYHQGSIGADYFLSKRTDVYLVAVYQKASGTDSTGHPAVASINVLTPSNNDRQAVVRVAIRHKF